MTEKNQALITIPAEALEGLYAIATGQLEHEYNGACPDKVEGAYARDNECPACRALIAADAELRAIGAALPKFVPAKMRSLS